MVDENPDVRSTHDIVRRVAALVPSMQRRAAELDATATFPTDDLTAIRDAGVLEMPLPIELDAEAAERGSAADGLAGVMVQLGVGNLSVGRVVEAHFNARHLIARYGAAAQRTATTRDLSDGQLFALWVTDRPADCLRMTRTSTGIALVGRKMFCSAAGHANSALVTAMDEAGDAQMLVLRLGGDERVEPLPSPLQGMRAAVTGAVDFTGCTAPHVACLGAAGDYLREPDFSAGAWRGSAVAFGGLSALLQLAPAQLATAGRLDSPHTLQRLGSAMIACETSRLWVGQVARIAEARGGDAQRIVAYVGLARIAVETACLDAMRLVQRSLGLSAFRQGNPVERICRDLATYLRQPAADEVLTEAADHFARQPVPEWP